MTPESHSLDCSKGVIVNLSGVISLRFGSNCDGGDVFSENLYWARKAATANYVSSTEISNGKQSTSGMGVGRGINRDLIDTIVVLELLDSSANRFSD